MTEWLHFHFSLSSIGEGNGNPPQCSCLENPRDGGAWWAAVGHDWSDLAAAAAAVVVCRHSPGSLWFCRKQTAILNGNMSGTIGLCSVALITPTAWGLWRCLLFYSPDRSGICGKPVSEDPFASSLLVLISYVETQCGSCYMCLVCQTQLYLWGMGIWWPRMPADPVDPTWSGQGLHSLCDPHVSGLMWSHPDLLGFWVSVSILPCFQRSLKWPGIPVSSATATQVSAGPFRKVLGNHYRHFLEIVCVLFQTTTIK